MKELNPKHQRFADEYLVDGNAAAAAVRAGYAANSARVHAARLLKRPEIAAYVKDKQETISARLEITTERIIQEAKRLALADPQKLVHPDGRPKSILEIDDDTRACIASIEFIDVYEGSGKDRRRVGVTTKFKLWDKNPALDRLFKHHDLFAPKRVDVKGTFTNRVVGLAELLEEIDGADTGIGPAQSRMPTR